MEEIIGHFQSGCETICYRFDFNAELSIKIEFQISVSHFFDSVSVIIVVVVVAICCSLFLVLKQSNWFTIFDTDAILDALSISDAD